MYSPVRPGLLPPGFDRKDFLEHYWQKKPLLIRAGELSFRDPVSPEELAGLACEDFIESRLVKREAGCAEGAGAQYPDQWFLRYGPFNEEDFQQLPDRNWSLLVQAVDHWIPGVKALLGNFDFIPSWRMDDVMVSYATDGGGVGPHFDYYDVFLIQGTGSKIWQLGGRADSGNKLQAESELRLLADFHAQEEYEVGPGDILYLPPNYAHFGHSIGESVTYSIGFRTPSWEEILSAYSEQVTAGLGEDQRYVDPSPSIPARQGEIEAQCIDQLVQGIETLMLDRERLRQWFGRHMTSPKYADLDAPEDNGADTADRLGNEQLLQAVEGGAVLYRNPASRFAFSETPGNSKEVDAVDLFVDSKHYPCPGELLPLVLALCALDEPGSSRFTAALQDPASRDLITQLYNHGGLLLDAEPEVNPEP